MDLNKNYSEGTPESIYLQGLQYLKGDRVEENPQKAFSLFMKAAALGYTASYFAVGACYLYGMGTEKDIDEGIRWYTKAAVEAYDVEAQRELGDIYLFGNEEVPIDDKEAIKWYRMAIRECRDGESMYQLASCYDEGWGIEENPMMAALWYHKAAEYGHQYSIFKLAECYMFGNGVKQSVMTSLGILKQYVDNGNEIPEEFLDRLKRAGITLEFE